MFQLCLVSNLNQYTRFEFRGVHQESSSVSPAHLGSVTENWLTATRRAMRWPLRNPVIRGSAAARFPGDHTRCGYGGRERLCGRRRAGAF